MILGEYPKVLTRIDEVALPACRLGGKPARIHIIGMLRQVGLEVLAAAAKIPRLDRGSSRSQIGIVPKRSSRPDDSAHEQRQENESKPRSVSCTLEGHYADSSNAFRIVFRILTPSRSASKRSYACSADGPMMVEQRLARVKRVLAEAAMHQ